MNIQLDKPVNLTLQPNTMAVILDLLAKNLPYNLGKEVLEGEIFPQLVPKPEEKSGDNG